MLKFCTIILFTSMMLSCHSVKSKKDKNSSSSDSPSAKVELYYFHQTKRCKTCKAVGDLAKQFVLNNYKNQNNKDVVFHDVNISLEENQSISDKFQVNWSGLYILNHSSKVEEINNLTEFAFMYAVDKPDTVIKVLKNKISDYLKIKI